MKKKKEKEKEREREKKSQKKNEREEGGKMLSLTWIINDFESFFPAAWKLFRWLTWGVVWGDSVTYK